MKPKIHEAGTNPDGSKLYMFHCPGCGNSHGFTVGGAPGAKPRWTWNGSFDKPTFKPSLWCNKDYPESSCHLYVEEGKIQFLKQCWHALANTTVEIPDWESR